MRTVILNKEDINKGYLILVNRDNPISENIIKNSMRLVPVDTEHSDILLEIKTATLLSQLLKTIESYDEIVPVSGYRDRNEQEKIYNDSLLENGSVFTSKYVALPNRSEHQTGLAIDLGKNSDMIDFICPDFPYTGICGKFRQHAARHGFIERYGEGKESQTGISHEPWHFRYVGYPHSKIMEDNKLCLEEYIHFIKQYPLEGKHYIINDNSKEIEVYYVLSKSETRIIEIPENESYQISGNNVDGFIVTIWR